MGQQYVQGHWVLHPAPGVGSFQPLPVGFGHWVLSLHFTVLLNGLVASLPVNLFCKKFWALSIGLGKNQDENKAFGVMLWQVRAKDSGRVVSEQCSQELSLFTCFLFWVLFWAWQCCIVVAEDLFIFHQTPGLVGKEAVHFSADEMSAHLAELEWGWEPQFRIWLPKVLPSAEFGGMTYSFLPFLPPCNFQHMFCFPSSHRGSQF